MPVYRTGNNVYTTVVWGPGSVGGAANTASATFGALTPSIRWSPLDTSPNGDWILEAQVPQSKLLLFPGLLGTRSLAAEAEVLALGGDYEVRASYD